MTISRELIKIYHAENFPMIALICKKKINIKNNKSFATFFYCKTLFNVKSNKKYNYLSKCMLVVYRR